MSVSSPKISQQLAIDVGEKERIESVDVQRRSVGQFMRKYFLEGMFLS
jgi:hypothetical protein